jgi:hypothetical protein
MRFGMQSACELVGFPLAHGAIFQQVADQLDVVISSREIGRSCTGLVEEGYAMKGFRIDTKSCNWGPMMGFVCMDPRLSKLGGDPGGVSNNKGYTAEALSGTIPHHLSHPDPGEAAGWKADVVPIAISQKRLDELMAGIDGKKLTPLEVPDGVMNGVAIFENTNLKLPYVLIRITKSDGNYGDIGADEKIWGVFIDPGKGFQQMYPPNIPGVYRQTENGKYHEALLGLANPGSGRHGYKACVTGDYDLFGVWPKSAVKGRESRPSARAIHTAKSRGLAAARKIGNDTDWDERRIESGEQEHFMLGNITRRINLVKVMLNTALQVSTDIKAFGQCVHHSDEAGNPGALQKTLDKSMPVIAFIPGIDPVGVERIGDLQALCMLAKMRGYAVDLRKDWVGQIGNF